MSISVLLCYIVTIRHLTIKLIGNIMTNEYVNKLEDECEDMYRKIEEQKGVIEYLNTYIKELESVNTELHDAYVELTGKAFDYGVHRSG